MDDRGAARLLRGLVTAGLCTLLIAVGHVLGGGALPDLAVLAVLFPLLTGAVVGLADRCRNTAATVAVLAGGQYALHVLLGVLHPHGSATGPSAVTMVALHAAATVVVALLLRHADRALVAAGSAVRRMLRRPFVPPADAPRPPPVRRRPPRAPVAAPPVRPPRRPPPPPPARRGPPAAARAPRARRRPRPPWSSGGVLTRPVPAPLPPRLGASSPPG